MLQQLPYSFAMADDVVTVSESIVAQLADDDAASMLAGQADIVDAVLAANRVFVAVAAGALANLEPEVTLPQFRALVLIDMHRSMTVAELAEALDVVPSTATRMCDRLVAKQLVDRVVDSANRRQMALTLRPEGRALIAQSTRQRKREINRLLKSIPPHAQTDLAAALGLLVQAAHGSDRTRASRDPRSGATRGAGG
jgi:DNA-binding MarR family transcriptional regulator